MGRPLNSLNRKGRNDRKGKVSELKKTLIFKGDLTTEQKRLAKKLGFNPKEYTNSLAGRQQLNTRIERLTGIKANKVKSKVLAKDVNKRTEKGRKKNF